MFNSDENDDFRLTKEEAKQGQKGMVIWLLYIALGSVILVTGAHAIMLVLAQAPEYAGGSGLLHAFLNVIRIAFPVIVEVCAVVAGLGFMGSKWRKGQKWVAGGVEFTWFVFAAANMITFFRLERGLPLESWQINWTNYGLPLSALIAGVLTYFLVRADPDHKRSDEEVAAEEKIKMMRFAVRRDVMISPQMRAIEKQRAWLEVVQAMRTAGYTDAQIRFMLQDTPQLLIDADQNGQPDLLESGNEPGGIRNTIQGIVDRVTGNNSQPEPAAASESPPLPTETRPRDEQATPASDNGRYRVKQTYNGQVSYSDKSYLEAEAIEEARKLNSYHNRTRQDVAVEIVPDDTEWHANRPPSIHEWVIEEAHNRGVSQLDILKEIGNSILGNGGNNNRP